MQTPVADVVELADYAFGRLAERLEGLTGDELAWLPTDEETLGLAWRLWHLDTEVLAAPRNWEWLGSSAPAGLPTVSPATAPAVVEQLVASFVLFRALIGDPSIDMRELLGEQAGPYSASTRLAYVLHCIDELIHHGAEAALLRDLYLKVGAE